MPTTLNAYAAYEDLHFCGETYRVTVSLGTVDVTLNPGHPKSQTCLWGRLEANDGVLWTDVFHHPGVKDAAAQTVREMLRWSREQKAREEHKRKYGYYPGECVE